MNSAFQPGANNSEPETDRVMDPHGARDQAGNRLITPKDRRSRTDILTTVTFRGGIQIPVRIRDHAVERFAERFRPALEPGLASQELARLVAIAQVHTERPAWLGPTQQRPAFYICLGDIVMPADPDPNRRERLLIRTVLPHSPISHQSRHQLVLRKRRRAIRAEARRKARARRQERTRRPQRHH